VGQMRGDPKINYPEAGIVKTRRWVRLMFSSERRSPTRRGRTGQNAPHRSAALHPGLRVQGARWRHRLALPALRRNRGRKRPPRSGERGYVGPAFRAV
jgi:hypothetical protein